MDASEFPAMEAMSPKDVMEYAIYLQAENARLHGALDIANVEGMQRKDWADAAERVREQALEDAEYQRLAKEEAQRETRAYLERVSSMGASLAVAVRANAELRAALAANLNGCGECSDPAHELARAALCRESLATARREMGGER